MKSTGISLTKQSTKRLCFVQKQRSHEMELWLSRLVTIRLDQPPTSSLSRSIQQRRTFGGENTIVHSTQKSSMNSTTDCRGSYRVEMSSFRIVTSPRTPNTGCPFELSLSTPGTASSLGTCSYCPKLGKSIDDSLQNSVSYVFPRFRAFRKSTTPRRKPS